MKSPARKGELPFVKTEENSEFRSQNIMNILNIAVDQHLLKMRRRATTVTSDFDFCFSETQNLWILYFELDVKGVTRPRSRNLRSLFRQGRIQNRERALGRFPGDTFRRCNARQNRQPVTSSQQNPNADVTSTFG